MNILTFDIEEWFLNKAYFGDEKEKYKVYDYYLDRVLGCLNDNGYKATFFCVGEMANLFPNVVKKIAEEGHEIGCHSLNHIWLNKMSEEDVYEDTRKAIDSLEQCLGRKIKSYRAPAFSIGENNKFVFNILAKCGIERDASIFPAKRDFGGFSQFGRSEPTIVKMNNGRIKEFPVCTTRLLGEEVAYSGGGYFRFFPLRFIQKEMFRAEYTMTYFHIGELVPETGGLMDRHLFESYFRIPGTLRNRTIRYIKSNLGKKGAFKKLLKLINSESFVNVEQADSLIEWEKKPSFVLD